LEIISAQFLQQFIVAKHTQARMQDGANQLLVIAHMMLTVSFEEVFYCNSFSVGISHAYIGQHISITTLAQVPVTNGFGWITLNVAADVKEHRRDFLIDFILHKICYAHHSRVTYQLKGKTRMRRTLTTESHQNLHCVAHHKIV
jgi:hypothetical protein